MIEILKLSLITFMFCAIIQMPKSILSWYDKLIGKLPDYLYKPLGGCYMCFTGEVFLWYFIFTKPFDFFELAFFVSAGILSSMVYHKLYCYLT